MSAIKDLEDAIIDIICENEGLTEAQLIEKVFGRCVSGGQTKRTIRRSINYLAERQYFRIKNLRVFYPSAKSKRECAKAQEDA